MTETLEPALPAALPRHPRRLSRGAWSWSFFEAARNPYVLLITIYVFMPYFATVMVGDPVRGQALVASYGKWAGWIVAFTAPVLGASIDRMGSRKPMLGLIVGLMVPAIYALWWARPDGSGLSIGAVVALAVFINVLVSYSEVVHNSMLPRAAGQQAAEASGLALAFGCAASVVMLLFVLWAFALPGATQWGFVPDQPLFGLDRSTHETDRIVGPIVAVFLAIGVLPIFLFTPDAPRGVGVLPALRGGLSDLGGLVRKLRSNRDASIFLLSRMFYADGKTALLIFGGVYAAGVMQWAVLEMLAFGVVLSIFAVLGGFLGGWMDRWCGPKRAVQIEIGASAVFLIGQLGMARDRILYLWEFDTTLPPLWNGPMFRTAPEVTYLLLGIGVSIFVTAAYASSRTLLTRLTPAAESGSYFGLYALSGTATMWLGPTLVQGVTEATGTQQAGFGSVAILLLLGFVGLFFVKGGGRSSVTPEA
jgi:UMF1 family MFS transporter